MGLWEFFFGGDESPEKKEADKKWADKRKKDLERKHQMSAALANELDLINRQHGKQKYGGGFFGGQPPVHPKDKDTTNNDWWF